MLVNAISTTIWVVIVVVSEATAIPVVTLAEKIGALGNLNFVFYFNYINAALITLFDVALFAGVYLYCRDDEPFWATIAVAFVPIYGLGNLLAYLSQVFMVPHLLTLYRAPETVSIATVLLGLTLHTWSGSAVEFINGLSYAILGIPSIIFSAIMFYKTKALRAGSVLLAHSGLLSIIALIGAGLQNPILTKMSLVSGFIFLIALILIGLFLVRQPVKQAK
jgi:hypothetical protein